MPTGTSAPPKKVSLFLPSLIFGGAEMVTLNLAEGLVELGHQVDIVLAERTGRLLERVPAGVTVTDLGVRRTLAATLPLARYLRATRPDVIVAAMGHANVVTMWAKRLAGSSVRTVLTEHRTAPLEVGSVVEGLFRRLARIEYPRATAVLAVSGGVADNLAAIVGMDRSRISVVYNPVLTDTYWRQLDEPLEHPWFEPGSPPVVLAAGRLVSDKDFATLVRAFHLVRRERRARLVILGEGELRPELEALVAELGLTEDVALPGFEPNPYKYMAGAAAFALSSVSEGLPTVLIEAIAAGLPVVSTDCVSGPREILAHTQAGQLVPVGDHEAMARALLEALAGEKGGRGAARGLDAFAPALVAERYLELAAAR